MPQILKNVVYFHLYNMAPGRVIHVKSSWNPSTIFMACDKKIQMDVGILDFSLLLDTIPHERLFGKLASYSEHAPPEFVD